MSQNMDLGLQGREKRVWTQIVEQLHPASLCGMGELPMVERDGGLLCPVHRGSRQVPPHRHPRTTWQAVPSIVDGTWAGCCFAVGTVLPGGRGEGRGCSVMCATPALRKTTCGSHLYVHLQEEKPECRCSGWPKKHFFVTITWLYFLNFVQCIYFFYNFLKASSLEWFQGSLRTGAAVQAARCRPALPHSLLLLWAPDGYY